MQLEFAECLKCPQYLMRNTSLNLHRNIKMQAKLLVYVIVQQTETQQSYFP